MATTDDRRIENNMWFEHRVVKAVTHMTFLLYWNLCYFQLVNLVYNFTLWRTHTDAGYRSGADELIELTYKDLPTKGRDGLNIYKTHTDRVTARSNRSGTNEHIEPTDWLTAKSNKSGTDEHPVKPRCGQFPSGLSHAVSLRLFAEATGASPLPNMVLVSNTS